MSNPKLEKNKKIEFKNFWLYFLLFFICAIIAGIFGGTIMRGYIIKDIYSPYSDYSEVDLGNLNPSNPSLIISEPKNVVVNQDVKISETINNLKPSFVSVFEKIEVPIIATKLIDDNSGVEVDAEKIDYNYYDLRNPLLIGFIITSDGWAIASVDDNFDFLKTDLVVVDSNRRVYELVNLSEVNSDGLILFRLSEAKNLVVRKNLSKINFFLGQSLLAFKDLNSVHPLNVSSLKETQALLSSESSSLSLELSVPAQDIKNSFIFNLAGDLALIVNNKGELVPAFSYDYQWRSLIETNSLGRPFLGINYLDLSDIKIASSSQDLNKGALLFSDGKVPAVLINSPAAKAGLKEGDIITWINNYELNSGNDLAEIVSLYKPGDKLTINYLREGKTFKLELVLEPSPLEVDISPKL
ncbi:PDZ domain-containing protein [Candidatus Falkowbacteria bacterium]|nr:PDZ domain-containing protein [Candidatus Falkowbacteria bacterium]